MAKYALRCIELPQGANRLDINASFIPVALWRKETVYNIYSTVVNFRLQRANTTLDADSVDPCKMVLGRSYLASFANAPDVDLSGFEVSAGAYYLIQAPNAALLGLDHAFYYLERLPN